MTAKLDASATIYLGKANLLALAAQVCGGLAITTGVYEEVVVRGQEVGHRDAETIAKAVQDRLVEVISLTEASRRRLDQAGFSPRLGNGEQESGGAREQGSMGAGEHGSRGVGERRRVHPSSLAPMHLSSGSTSAQKRHGQIRTSRVFPWTRG